jgi:molybdopterin converting factor small subunit
MYPGLTDYLVDEQGALRKHVNIYIGENLIEDRTNLKDIVNPSDEVLIFQALSGG